MPRSEREEANVHEAFDEEMLMAKAQAGDQAALGQLLLHHYDMLQRMVEPRIPSSLRRLLSVEDVLQQTFSSAFRHFDQFTPVGEGAFGAWLRAIAERRMQDCVRELRRKKRGGDHHQVGAYDAAGSDSAAELIQIVSAGISTPSRIVSREEAIRALHIAMAELPEDYQEVLRLRYFQGLTIEETAEALERTADAVRAVANRAKKKLREILGRMSDFLSSH